MKTKMQFACQEDWNKMKVGLISRHCDSCNKPVFDFTKMKREEVLLYLLENRGKKVCARLLPSQIDYHHEDLLITIEKLLVTHRNSNFAFFLLTIGSLTLLGCSSKPSEQNKKIEDSSITNIIEVDSLLPPPDKMPPELEEKLIHKTCQASTITEITEIATLGMPVIVSDDTINSEPYDLVSKMPEFVGGLDSLVAFVRKNIKYPSHEVEGTTFVSIVIDSTGKVINPTILKSLGKDFDAEALRIISLMPDWIPGENLGKKISVRYVIPITFKYFND
jgi:TonB family protein